MEISILISFIYSYLETNNLKINWRIYGNLTIIYLAPVAGTEAGYNILGCNSALQDIHRKKLVVKMDFDKRTDT